MSEKLERCPFCGGTDIRILPAPAAEPTRVTVVCWTCEAMRADETERAIDGWNRRAPAVPQEVREAMRRLSDIVHWVRYGDVTDEADVATVRAWLAAQE